MKKCSGINKYETGGLISRKPKKINLNNVTADPLKGGKSVTGDPKVQTVGPHLYELPKSYTSDRPSFTTTGIDNGSKTPKVKLKNPRQKSYVTGGSSSTLKDKTNNAKTGLARKNSKTCTTTSCPKN